MPGGMTEDGYLLVEVEDFIAQANEDLESYEEGEWAPDHRDWKHAMETALEFAKLLKERL